jgi:hypothetical protein
MAVYHVLSVRLLEDALRWGSADLFSPAEMARDQAVAEAQVRSPVTAMLTALQRTCELSVC